MPGKTPPLFPFGDLWIPVIPFLPLVIFTVFLTAIVDFRVENLAFLKFDFDALYLDPVLRNYIHLGDLLVYYSISLLHVFICLGVILFFVYLTKNLPPRERLKSAICLGLMTLLALVLIYCFARWANEIVLVELGFKATCLAIDGAGLATRLMKPGACFEDGYISTFTWLAWVPSFAGMAAVGFAAAFAYGNTGGLPARDDPAWRPAIEARLKSLQRGVYALSAVLVTSTITITLFARLPMGLIGPEGGDLADAMAGYTGGLGTFWGVLFTLTLAAAFAAPAWRLLQEAYGDRSARDESMDLRRWLHEHVFVSFKTQLGNALVVLAPLLTGSFSSIVSFFAG